MNELWIVRFVRKDGKPDEEYYYHSLAKAEYHRDLFLNDDSGLYEKIEIINENSKEVTMELNFIMLDMVEYGLLTFIQMLKMLLIP